MNSKQLQPNNGNPPTHSLAAPIAHSSLLTPRHCPVSGHGVNSLWQSTNAKRTWKFGCWLFPYPKSAFTLIELLVYIAILGFIIVVAGRAFSDSQVLRIRSQNMLKTAEQVGRAANLMREDISQMGSKAWGRDTNITATPYLVFASDSVYMAATATVPDSSSYILTPDRDSLVFRKAAFDSAGNFLCAREIAWYAAESGTSPDGTPLMDLFRKCRSILSSACAAEDIDTDRTSLCPANSNINESQKVLVAQKVKTLKFIPSVPGVSAGSAASDSIFPPAGSTGTQEFKLQPRTDGALAIEPTITNNGTQTEVSGFAWNDPSTAGDDKDAKFNQLFLTDNSTTEGAADAWQNCIAIPSIQKGETYIVEFRMPFIKGLDSAAVYNSTQFQPGIDHIAVGLRDKSGNPIDNLSPDVFFYAPQSADATNKPLYAEFSASEDISAPCCLAISTAFYSPKANKGKLRFSNFKILKKQTGAYHFARTEDGYSADYGTKADTQEGVKEKQSVKAFELILEINNNGEIAGTYSKESKGMTIPVPNNGAASKPSN